MHPVERHSQRKASVGVCIPTFRRREYLRQLLIGISKLTFRRMPAPDIRVIVVDNDADRSAADICDSTPLPWPAKYVVEPQRGIARARNRAITEAGDHDFIVFIDDDEVPTPLWLDELLWTQACFRADVVCGPVLPRYASGTPEWVKTGGFFSTHAFDNGLAIETGYTGNVMISRQVLSTVPAFDERFAFTGGEDTHFFLRVRKAGFKIISSGAGVVYEAIPASRANLKWLLRRAYQAGSSWVLCETSLDRRTSTRVVRIFKATGRILQGAISACVSPIFGKAAFAQALSNLFLGAGMFAAMTGRSFQSYQSAGTDSAE